MDQFDLDAFITGINNDKSASERDVKKRLNKIQMNSKDTQGTLTFIPLYSKEANNFYMTINRVYEYYGDTSLLENSEEGWFKVLPLAMYEGLTDEQKELYSEVKGYLDELNDREEVSYDEFRVRNYSLFFGIMVGLKTISNKVNNKLVNAPCLFVYPSKKPISQLCDAINTKIDLMHGKRDWLTRILSLKEIGRKGVVQVKFVKVDAGYDCTVALEFNNEDYQVIDEDLVIDQDIFSKFDEIIPTFLGWNYDKEMKSYFNEIAFKELRDQLKLRIQSLETNNAPTDEVEAPENKNNLNKAKGDSELPF